MALSVALVPLALVFVFVSITYLAANRTQRKTLLNRLTLRGRDWPGKGLLPRSISPGKRTSTKANSGPTYETSFPPSCRPGLGDVYDDLPLALKTQSRGKLIAEPDLTKRKMIPLGASNDQLPGDFYTPTGFALDEVRKLGDFPNYSALSGVPLPSAYTNFDLSKAEFRPYRPFRWPYHQTMSLTKLEADWWLEIERDYVARVEQRKQLYEEHKDLVLQYLPGSEYACKELMEHCLQFLCARHPTLFSLNAPHNTVFTNRILGITTDLKAMHPLVVMLENVPEDFAIMQRDPQNGKYYFRAGMICSSLGWSVGSKIGKQLAEVHDPVPDFKEKMEFSMDRFFAKMPTSKPIQRGSWGLEIDCPLFVPNPPTATTPNLDNLREIRLPSEELPTSRIHLRVDWQTLRRLPLSGAIVFNFKAVFTPFERFREEPKIPALCLKAVKEGKPSILDYKGTWAVGHVTEQALECWRREQEGKGMVEKDWEVETLKESPFFEGWEGLWRRRQGFREAVNVTS
ncbi:MAG: hypothetical protein M1828_002019 [Chrysothrix sp. TS-e1954]|nr:MAG: hypothetical protein M1828_002019 [Chrysothrix sp. TS-e1954]